MAAQRRVMVDAAMPFSASAARKPATVSGLAGRALTLRAVHQTGKIEKSDRYTARVAALLSWRAKLVARSMSAAGRLGKLEVVISIERTGRVVTMEASNWVQNWTYEKQSGVPIGTPLDEKSARRKAGLGELVLDQLDRRPHDVQLRATVRILPHPV